MAKGKKYAKWYAKHFKALEERKNKPKPVLQRNKPFLSYPEVQDVELKHPVHGYFIYECERCGRIYQMYLDKGLEDRVSDALYPDKHKPVPFTILCKECVNLAETLKRKELYGVCRHILWGIGDSDTYTELPDGASYFRNDPNEPHGIPVYNISYRNKKEWQISMMRGRFE